MKNTRLEFFTAFQPLLPLDLKVDVHMCSTRVSACLILRYIAFQPFLGIFHTLEEG